MELDENCWFSEHMPSRRAVVAHMQFVNDRDLAQPILLDPETCVTDRMHRVAKALLLGHTHVLAKRSEQTPKPDYIGTDPDNLPYGHVLRGTLPQAAYGSKGTQRK